MSVARFVVRQPIVIRFVELAAKLITIVAPAIIVIDFIIGCCWYYLLKYTKKEPW